MHPEAAKKWFTKAYRDLRSAKALIDLEDPDLELTAFAAQQCAEKSIKGFLTFHGRRVPKIHEMRKIIDLALKADPSLERSLDSADELTPYAVKIRYPDASDIPEVTVQAAREAISIAQSVFELLSKRIQS